MRQASKIKAPAVSSLAIILSIAILMFPTGCATTKDAYPPPLPKETRASLGTMGVAHADSQPQIWLGQKPLGKGEAAWEGTKKGAGVMLNLAGESGHGGEEVGALFAVFFVVLSVFAGATGLVVGAAKGVSEEDVNKAEAGLNEALSALNIQETMCNTLIQTTAGMTGYKLVPTETGGWDEVYGHAGHMHLSDKGIDTLLRIEVIDVGFYGKKGINPQLEFSARVLVRLYSVRDGRELYSQIFIYAGKRLEFCEWAEDDARPLREEFDRFYLTTAGEIVDRLFVMETD